jgi:hypothetical protein|tara:strand:- start:42 stop:284 length:243 start_codon:yes stop_codon:yes gene_type:complete
MIYIWKNEKRTGQGTFTWANGDKYVGEWKDGKKHGQGTFTYSEGMKYVGEYKDGLPWNGIYYDKNGNIEIKYVNGKMIRQ